MVHGHDQRPQFHEKNKKVKMGAAEGKKKRTFGRSGRGVSGERRGGGRGRGGSEHIARPPACVALQRAAVAVSPTSIVWRGDQGLSTHQQGLEVLGVPFGHPDFVLQFLEAKIAEHRVLQVGMAPLCHIAQPLGRTFTCGLSTRISRTSLPQPTATVCGSVFVEL